MINMLMSLWLGQGGNPAFDKLGLKRVYYNLMLEQWKLSFLKQGLNFSNPNYTIATIIRQFELLEKVFNLRQPRQDQGNPSCSGGRQGGGKSRDQECSQKEGHGGSQENTIVDMGPSVIINRDAAKTKTQTPTVVNNSAVVCRVIALSILKAIMIGKIALGTSMGRIINLIF